MSAMEVVIEVSEPFSVKLKAVRLVSSNSVSLLNLTRVLIFLKKWIFSFIVREVHPLRCGGGSEVPVRLVHQSGITSDDREEDEGRALCEQVIRQRDVENMVVVQFARKQHRADNQHKPNCKEGSRQSQVVPPMAA